MRRIPLTQGKCTIVDDEDYEHLNRWKWYAIHQGRQWYATRGVWKKGKYTAIRMHRLILNTPPDMQTDHINHDGLDNRRANLRVCNQSQNNGNTRKCQRPTSSRFKGVSWKKAARKWQSHIKHRGRRIHLGYFDNELEAAKAYDRAALELFGEFALTNLTDIIPVALLVTIPPRLP